MTTLNDPVEFDRQLKDVLADFARTMLTEFRLDVILDELVSRIVMLLPITAAGVTLIGADHSAHKAAASDRDALRFEHLQSDLGEGPCIEAFHSGAPVEVPDLALSSRFPLFTSHALKAGLRAVFTFPLHHGNHRLGALDLYRDTPGPLTEDAVDAAKTLADVAAAYLINAQGRLDLNTASARAQEAAIHDTLTGLPNRTLLVDRLHHALARTQRNKLVHALIYLDLDGFKRVNDIYGHSTGDHLLVAVAQRLDAAIRPSDTAARLHGDEFAVLCEDLDDAAHGQQIAQRLEDAFVAPFRIDGMELADSASIGIAYGTADDRDPEAIIHRADLAMLEAKRVRSGPEVFTPDLQVTADDRATLTMDLQHAVNRDQLRTVYQPIVELATGTTTGFEALLRWTHPSRGPVSPAVLIPLAEESGLITDIGRFVLRRAVHDRRIQHRPVGGPPMAMSVNVSARQLMAGDFTAVVAETLSEIPPDRLHLEVTESVLLADEARAREVLGDLKDMGVTMSLDDFGTGYSSLIYLKRFPFDIIKIDRSFVNDLVRDAASHAIVSSIIDLVHVLGMTAIAEGIETDAQRELLTELGCDAGQGYLFARPGPLPASD